MYRMSNLSIFNITFVMSQELDISCMTKLDDENALTIEDLHSGIKLISELKQNFSHKFGKQNKVYVR